MEYRKPINTGNNEKLKNNIKVTNTTRFTEAFSIKKLRNSPARAKATANEIDSIVELLLHNCIRASAHKKSITILAELKRKMSDKLIILKIDIDKSLQAATTCKILEVPYLMLIYKEEIKWRQ